MLRLKSSLPLSYEDRHTARSPTAVTNGLCSTTASGTCGASDVIPDDIRVQKTTLPRIW